MKQTTLVTHSLYVKLSKNCKDYGEPDITYQLAALSIYTVRPAPATSTSTAPQPANAMSCCCSVVPVLLSILPCKTSPRSSASPRRCFPKFAKTSLSEHKNSIFTKIH